jgi:hypothetical protein
MSASFARPTTFRHQLVASRKALEIVDDLRDESVDLKGAIDLLNVWPADADERRKVRNAARQTIALCDELERITGLLS